MTSLADVPASVLAELHDAGLDPESLWRQVAAALEEDLPGRGAVDVTSTATIPADASAVADFGAREAGVVAGLGLAALVFHAVMGEAVEITSRVPDGTRAQVLDTRKTLPTFRALQKYAVRCGGGVNHRFSLSDMALVKDNHVVAAGGVLPAFDAVRNRYPDIPVEVEVTDLDQLRQLLDAGCERILLDNMSTDLMAEAVRLTAGRATLEASGGLTFDRAREVAETGVDFISVGALTHSVKVFDIGMDLRP
jgi:nicotinate-nucleotide pyrophosphorylase (carboxylating)